jgi:formylglycine-generating enzyme required for sulfatase activity
VFTAALLKVIKSHRGPQSLTAGGLGESVAADMEQRVLELNGKKQQPHPISSGVVDLHIQPSNARLRPPPLSAPFSSEQAQAAQQAWAQYLGKPVIDREPTTGMALALIPPGEFSMGSPEADRTAMLRIYPDSNPEWFADEQLYRVRISQPFYLGIHEVNVGQFRQFVEATRYQTEAEKDGQEGFGWNMATGKLEGRKPEYTWRDPGFPQTADHPVVNDSWNDATAFCAWLSQPTKLTFRLLREAEWEYACRAGTAMAFSNGDDIARVAAIANIADASARETLTNYRESWVFEKERDGYVFKAQVGRFAANRFGLHEMHGNV